MRRLLIAVEPQLLASSLAQVFGSAYDVILCNADGGPDCHADLAIVSDSRRELIDADTIISLPDVEGNAGLAVVWQGDQATPVRIGTLNDLVRAVAAVPA
jgi:hypothetical protein